MSLDGLVRGAHASPPMLPFNPIPFQQLVVVEMVVRKAWLALLGNAGIWKADLKNDAENFITDPLLNIINFLRDNASEVPFPTFRDHFHPVTQNSSYRSYDRTALKSPDLIFTPKAGPYPGLDVGYYAYFVEAKILDASPGKSKTIRKYFLDGVHRFVNGDYAWTMKHCLMLGYVRDAQTLPGALDSYLTNSINAAECALIPSPVWAKEPNPDPKVRSTNHDRTFTYTDRPGLPGPIEIRHLWLKVSSAP